MTAKSSTKVSNEVRYESLDDIPVPPRVNRISDNWTDEEIERRAAEDPDAGLVPPGFWDDAEIVEPEGTEQITLRLPRRVLSHFRATGKGYQSRISAVLASYVDARRKTG